MKDNYIKSIVSNLKKIKDLDNRDVIINYLETDLRNYLNDETNAE